MNNGTYVENNSLMMRILIIIMNHVELHCERARLQAELISLCKYG